MGNSDVKENSLYSRDQSLHEIVEHNNPQYPVGVYLVEPSKMYLQHVRWHWHEEIELDFVKEGTAVFRVGEEIIRVEEGQAIFINQNVLHYIESEAGTDCVVLSALFHPRFLFNDTESAIETMYLTPLLNDIQLRHLVFKRSDMWSRSILAYISDLLEANLSKEYGYELQTKSILCQFWFVMIKKFKSHQPIVVQEKTNVLSPDESRIKDALIYIQNHYADSVTLEDIADSIHVSKSECCRCFKRAMNVTPFEYLMRYRILQAADKLLKQDKSVTSIADLAFSVGFNNTSYFNKLFKEYFGCTPLQFRKTSKTEHRDTLSPFGLSLSHF